MSAIPWIAGGLGLGLAYYLYKKAQAPATEDDFCAKACKAAGSFCIDGGWSCRESNKIIGNFFDPGGAYYSERDRREGVNTGLNGAPDVTNPPEGVGSGVLDAPTVGTGDLGRAGTLQQATNKAIASSYPQTVGAKTLRYKNGCVPLFGAPGFAACKTGTLDMYSTAINVGAGHPFDLSEKNLETAGAFISFADRDVGFRGWQRINKDVAMTGGIGDPTTQGPFGPDVEAPWWYVRGRKVIGTKTKAPRAVVLQHYQVSHAGAELTTNQQIANLTDAQAMELVPIDVDPNASIRTDIGVGCGVANPGYSWVSTNRIGGGYWTRTVRGSTDKVRPCVSDVNANVSHTLEIGL